MIFINRVQHDFSMFSNMKDTYIIFYFFMIHFIIVIAVYYSEVNIMDNIPPMMNVILRSPNTIVIRDHGICGARGCLGYHYL